MRLKRSALGDRRDRSADNGMTELLLKPAHQAAHRSPQVGDVEQHEGNRLT